MAEFRLERVSTSIREFISTLIIEGRLKDPRISNTLSITRVKLSRDISDAKIFISSYLPDINLEKNVDALNHAAGFIRTKLGKRLHLKNTPNISFFPDHGIEEGFELNKKIGDLID